MRKPTSWTPCTARTAVVVSLVAEVGTDGGRPHPVLTGRPSSSPNGKRLVGLAPMAVAPDHQRQGIGSQLVREGLARCRAAGVDGVVVLGHAEYYPRFGFATAARFGLRCEYDVPADVFMAIELHSGCARRRFRSRALSRSVRRRLSSNRRLPVKPKGGAMRASGPMCGCWRASCACNFRGRCWRRAAA